jgi:hypothetical protein
MAVTRLRLDQVLFKVSTHKRGIPMKATRNIISLTAILCLPACATTGFAPPRVNLGYSVAREGAQRCDFSETARKKDESRKKINKNSIGALKLINNFIYSYRCAAHKVADGRQYFEVPSFLTAVGGVTAAAFGAGADVSIATGAAVSVLGGAKNYYAPKDKVNVLDGALNALICLKAEAVGVSAFNTTKLDMPADSTEPDTESEGQDKRNNNGIKNSGPKLDSELIDNESDTISFTAERRYFEMISAALLSVERILADRLSNIGNYDTAGIVAEIKALEQEVKDAKAASMTGKTGQDGMPTNTAGANMAEFTLMSKATVNSITDRALIAIVNKNTQLELGVLQPKLQQCVLRAKI